MCLTCTGDKHPGNDPETRQLPAVTNKPILIPVFVAGASTQTGAIAELGNNVTTNLMINGEKKDPLRLDAEIHGINFPEDNPFVEPAQNNASYHTVGFWYKIPATDVGSITTIEFVGSSSTFNTGVKYQR